MAVILLLLISSFASIIGGLCGVGGGVLIKPLLDFSGIVSVSTASFLSAVSVLAMASFSTAKNLHASSKAIDLKLTPFLALGAGCGGVSGKLLFECIKNSLPDTEIIGAIQAIFLGLVVIATFLYTLYKRKIRTHRVESRVVSCILGVGMGVMSSFLGIGGGPIDMIVLFYFYSMETKSAVQNSLFIILFSQAFSILFTVFTKSVPEFSVIGLAAMAVGGITGGAIGKAMSAKTSNEVIDKLFLCLLALIALICAYNFAHYLQ